MFDKLKKIKQLRDMQNSLKSKKETVERQGISVTINGNFEVEEIKLNPELDVKTQEDVLKKCLNEARENIQKIVAKSFMDSGIGGF